MNKSEGQYKIFRSFFYTGPGASADSSTAAEIGDLSTAAEGAGSSGLSSSASVDEGKKKKMRKKKRAKREARLEKLKADLMKSVTAKVEELVGNMGGSSSSDEEDEG